jgi:hypothetical protein
MAVLAGAAGSRAVHLDALARAEGTGGRNSLGVGHQNGTALLVTSADPSP